MQYACQDIVQLACMSGMQANTHCVTPTKPRADQFFDVLVNRSRMNSYQSQTNNTYMIYDTCHVEILRAHAGTHPHHQSQKGRGGNWKNNTFLTCQEHKWKGKSTWQASYLLVLMQETNAHLHKLNGL